jgi:glycosyltransferase involved in cell wall biosynthesis
MINKLLIISSDHISSWVKKGEVVLRYYNPGNVFDEIHLLLINNDKPNPELVQPMVGDAKLFIHNYPEPEHFFKKTLGWQPFLMEKWAQGAVKIAERIQPHMIRCYGIHLNAFLGSRIKKKLQIPFIISLHGNPDVDYLRGRLAENWRDKIIGKCQEQLEKFCLTAIDHVIAVYSPIESYLVKHKVMSYSIIHNTVGIGIEGKTDFSISSACIQLLCVGRQTYLQKDPAHIIEAVSSLQNVHLTLIGDGDLHDGLIDLAKNLGCDNRIKFIKTMNNKDLLKIMKEMDLYVYHSINYEISKSCIEAALVGLPVILNDRNGEPAQEIKDAGFYLVKDSQHGYRDAIERLVNDEQLRINVAKRSHHYANQNWAPEITEPKVANLYKRFINS